MCKAEGAGGAGVESNLGRLWSVGPHHATPVSNRILIFVCVPFEQDTAIPAYEGAGGRVVVRRRQPFPLL